jgi:23S rRNA (cytosine1962-C5)-methyltransferase
MGLATVRVTTRGAARWARGHPWIYRSDVRDHPAEAGLVRVVDGRGKFLGQALYSPKSEIRLRLLEPSTRPVDGAWWEARLRECLARRGELNATAYRVVHAEGDGLPSLVVDRYDRWVVAMLLSAGLESMRSTVLEALVAVLGPEGVLLRHDAPVRRHEGLAEEIVAPYGAVPEEIEIREGPVRYLAAPWTGQKTGAFLDQRPNRLLAGSWLPQGGNALDCFTYHGSFALHLALNAGQVTALDTSREALTRAQRNAALNGLTNIDWVEQDAFEALRAFERARRRFDVIVLDPPAFARNKSAVPQALRGYKELNLRALRLLSPAGTLFTASCSFHVRAEDFHAMLQEAAADSGRRCRLVLRTGQGADHPEILTIPETGYLKGAVVRAD